MPYEDVGSHVIIEAQSALSVDEIAPRPGSLGAKQRSQRNLRFFGVGGGGAGGAAARLGFGLSPLKSAITPLRIFQNHASCSMYGPSASTRRRRARW